MEFQTCRFGGKISADKNEVIEKPWGLPNSPGLMALFMFQMSSPKTERQNCSCTIQCLQSKLGLRFHKQLSKGSVTFCAMYRESDILAPWSKLAFVLGSLVFGPLPDTGSPWVAVRAFPSFHMVLEFVPPLPRDSEDGYLGGCCRAENRRGALLQQLTNDGWILRLVDFSVLFC